MTITVHRQAGEVAERVLAAVRGLLDEHDDQDVLRITDGREVGEMRAERRAAIENPEPDEVRHRTIVKPAKNAGRDLARGDVGPDEASYSNGLTEIYSRESGVSFRFC